MRLTMTSMLLIPFFFFHFSMSIIAIRYTKYTDVKVNNSMLLYPPLQLFEIFTLFTPTRVRFPFFADSFRSGRLFVWLFFRCKFERKKSQIISDRIPQSKRASCDSIASFIIQHWHYVFITNWYIFVSLTVLENADRPLFETDRHSWCGIWDPEGVMLLL